MKKKIHLDEKVLVIVGGILVALSLCGPFLFALKDHTLAFQLN